MSHSDGGLDAAAQVINAAYTRYFENPDTAESLGHAAAQALHAAGLLHTDQAAQLQDEEAR